MMDLRGKVALVTGAASGLGREIALDLDARGCRLLLVDRDDAGMARLARDLATPGGRRFRCDLGDVDQRGRAIAQVRGSEARIDVLVNCAGVGSHSLLRQLDAGEIGSVLSVNALAPLELTAGLVPLLPRGEPGCVVFIGSLAGELAVPGMSLYGASKAAVHAFSRAAAVELAAEGHVCLLVILGAMRGTRFVESIRHPAVGQPGWYRRLDVDPARAAARIVRAIERRRAGLVIPGWYGVLLWASRLLPRITRAATRLSYRRVRAMHRR
jgi:short-subunit dehydrogenase